MFWLRCQVGPVQYSVLVCFFCHVCLIFIHRVFDRIHHVSKQAETISAAGLLRLEAVLPPRRQLQVGRLGDAAPVMRRDPACLRYRGTYAEYAATSDYVRPDLLVAFHPGV